MTERLETLHYFEPDPSEPMYCKHCDAAPADPKVHAQEPRPPGRCWCGHVRVTHRPWAAGEFCTREGCGCRHYAEKRAGGEVLEKRPRC